MRGDAQDVPPSGSRSPSRTARTRAAAAQYRRAGDRTPGWRMPGWPGTAARSATPAAARDLARRRPGSAGSSPPHLVPQAEQLTLDAPVAPSAGSPAPTAPPARVPRPGPAADPARSDRSISS
jgi:hypothetical protein